MTITSTPDFLADLAADQEAQAQKLRDQQRAQREALAPAATLATKIIADRAAFLERDAALLEELTEALREAKRAGAPASYLEALARGPLTEGPAEKPVRKRAPRKAARKSEVAPAASVTANSGERAAPPVSTAPSGAGAALEPQSA